MAATVNYFPAVSTGTNPTFDGVTVTGNLDVGGDLTVDGTAVGFQSTFITEPIDLATTHAAVPLVPARAGYFPVMQARNWIIISVTGTQTNPATAKAGSNAGHDNFMASTATTPSNAEVNGAVPPSVSAGPGFPAATVQRIPNAAVVLDVTVAVTGATSLMARLAVQVAWFPG